MNPSRLVTIKDVAKEAGVSIGAVSKVLHGRGGNIRVSEGTAQRIRDAARTLSYRPNYHARSLRSGKSRSVGLVAGPVGESIECGLYKTYLSDRLVTILHAREYALNLAPELMPLANIAGLNDGRFDGLVWIDGAPSGPLIEAFYDSPVPVVGIGGLFGETPQRGALFLTDEDESYRLLLDHLIGLGHRSILYSDRPANSYNAMAEARRLGLFAEAERRGLKIQLGSTVEERAAICEWRDWPDRPTAIVAHSDHRGAMLMLEARRVGLSVPQDLSIVAFDGSPMTTWVWPGLTTVRPPVDELIGRACDHLIRQIEREPSDAVFETFMPVLDDAGSTSTPNPSS